MDGNLNFCLGHGKCREHEINSLEEKDPESFSFLPETITIKENSVN